MRRFTVKRHGTAAVIETNDVVPWRRWWRRTPANCVRGVSTGGGAQVNKLKAMEAKTLRPPPQTAASAEDDSTYLEDVD